MTVSDHLNELYGLPAFDFPEAGSEDTLPDPASVAWRITVEAYESDEQWDEAFARFTEVVDPTRVRALIVGAWSDVYDSGPDDVIETLVAARDRLPALRAVFLGDVTFDECEISWMHQTQVAPLLEAFPELTEFGLRGGQDLGFSPVRHERLRSLTIETGGLDAEVVRSVGASDLPALEHLDLWLGVSWYGGTTEVADLAPFLSGERFPRLRHLALRNSEIQDRIANALAGAPVVAGLEVLDLSMGTLGDEGAEALLTGQPLTHLKKLDLHHHFLSEAMRERLTTTLGAAGVEVDISEAETADGDSDGVEGRYTAVSE
ncbi:STM4015 family protein [Streptomyces sp. NPDC095613]|uniref:STM4015 family protein n=1 Tax=Streptomyces sp. NPDC095613 TaxID=3155540 RepID=UPI00331DA632